MKWGKRKRRERVGNITRKSKVNKKQRSIMRNCKRKKENGRKRRRIEKYEKE